MYAKCGSLAEAQVVFNMLSVHEQVSWNALNVGYAENWKFEEVLNQFHQTKDPWLAIVSHKTGVGRIIASFRAILYFAADMPFKTNGKICCLEKKNILSNSFQ